MTEDEIKLALRRQDAREARHTVMFAILAVVVVICLLFALLFGFKLINSKVKLSQAGNTKRIQIEDARGKAEAATLLATAEVERAKGVAEANRIIDGSLTDRYIRWLYVDQLDQTEGTIIYIPTEAGLPILETQRLAPDTEGPTG